MTGDKKSKVLVVGGAGYVGSATCAWLLDQGHEVWVLDDLSTGFRDLVLPSHPIQARFVRARAGDRKIVSRLLKQEQFDCVMHFAARSLVGESVQKPKEYWENNVEQTRALLELMITADIRNFIFSSTCAVFGDPGTDRLHETLPKKPLNPYGETKLEVERILERLANSHGLNSIALRYFNAAGAESELRAGEKHDPETHLIPRILEAAANGTPVEIYGTDYPTPDGTCIRDYIHVTDLARAHETAMLRLLERKARMTKQTPQGVFETFNLGSENGYSVREVIRACEKSLGRAISTIERPRRPGDPPKLVADSSLAHGSLSFRAEKGLEQIVDSAWSWYRKWKLIPPQKAVFLDRDGTLNEDPGYLGDAGQLKLFPTTGSALQRLQEKGYLLIVVSNQSGIGRGLFTRDALSEVHHRLDELLTPHKVSLDHYALCFHHPDENCECRKPKPLMLVDAARRLGIDLSQSYMVGDKGSDLAAGRAAGCGAVALVRTGAGRETEAKISFGEADFVGDSLAEVTDWILSRENAKP
ncbi:MAG: UDP-glucose 4-epimerase GalE [Bdellovibrionales bacterium GWB1_55_8]|nr:MAG: UDP-glucose 4-epimerase GalE [Bdellovibrionales bacterium GWB1_55_8]